MELKRIFKYRNFWIGIAMVWIVFFHSAIIFPWEPLNTFRDLGFCGVDICLFASGIGCYYSLEKDAAGLRFLRRRIRRLCPVYYTFIIPWLLYKVRSPHFPTRAIIGNLLGIQSLIEWNHHFNWYITGLLIYYLAIPLLKRITDSLTHVWQDGLAAVVLLVASIPLWGNGNAMIIASRFPVLYAGLVCAKMAKQGHVLQSRDFLGLGISASAGAAVWMVFHRYYPGLIGAWGMDWYPFALIVPGFCVSLALIAERVEKSKYTKWIVSLFSTVGIYSFEVYLVHIFLYDTFMYRVLRYFDGVPGNLLWVLSIPVIVCGVWVLNRAAALFQTSLARIIKR